MIKETPVIDNGHEDAGVPLRRFYLRRLKDETGVSRTGRVLEGILTQSGKVITEWRPPHSTIGVYNSFAEFKLIHIDCHPSCNQVVWLDGDWHCHACGAGSNDNNFCSRCGGGRHDYDGAFGGFKRKPSHCPQCLNENITNRDNFCGQCRANLREKA